MMPQLRAVRCGRDVIDCLVPPRMDTNIEETLRMLDPRHQCRSGDAVAHISRRCRPAGDMHRVRTKVKAMALDLAVRKDDGEGIGDAVAAIEADDLVRADIASPRITGKPIDEGTDDALERVLRPAVGIRIAQ